MGLCGGFRCGCGVSVAGSLALTGSGEPLDPYVISFDDGYRLSCMVSRVAAQTLTTGVGTPIYFDAESFDVGPLHSLASNIERITVPTGGAGLWQFGFTVAFSDSPTGTREAWMYKNGATSALYSYTAQSTGSSVGHAMSSSQLIRMNDGDYMVLWAVQGSGGDLAVRGNATASDISNFWAVRLGD